MWSHGRKRPLEVVDLQQLEDTITMTLKIPQNNSQTKLGLGITLLSLYKTNNFI